MNKKKVCIIGDLYQTFTGKNQGGGESQLVYAAKALNRLGFPKYASLLYFIHPP